MTKRTISQVFNYNPKIAVLTMARSKATKKFTFHEFNKKYPINAHLPCRYLHGQASNLIIPYTMV